MFSVARKNASTTAAVNSAVTNLDLDLSLAPPNFGASLSFNHILYVHTVDQDTNFSGHRIFAFVPGNSLLP
jgi:hypothetical protein